MRAMNQLIVVPKNVYVYIYMYDAINVADRYYYAKFCHEKSWQDFALVYAIVVLMLLISLNFLY